MCFLMERLSEMFLKVVLHSNFTHEDQLTCHEEYCSLKEAF